MRYSNKKKGMTLIEVILAMAIFGIIASGFLTMFTSSLIWIFGAGDKGEAYSMAQQDVEKRVAIKDAIESDGLTLNFGGTDYTIDGGIIESTQTVNTMDSTLETFVPFLPTISLNPSIRYEGDKDTSIVIEGERTSFSTTNTIVELYDHTGTSKLYEFSPDSVDITNQTLVVSLEDGGNPINLAKGDYIIRTKTTISGKPDQLSRAKYVVQQSRYIAVGGSTVYISANGKEWVDRENFPNIPSGLSGLNSVAGNMSVYMAVADKGYVLKSIDNAEWSYLPYSGKNLNDITFSIEFGAFYIVDNGGNINTLDASNIWHSYNSGLTQLNGVDSVALPGNKGMLFAVGNGGILTSINGTDWSSVAGSEGYNYSSVSSGTNETIAIGVSATDPYSGRSAVFDHSTEKWSFSPSTIPLMNDVTHIGSSNIIGVGNDGGIYLSNDGVSWSTVSISGLTNDLNGIYSSGSEVLICGDNGALLFSDDSGTTWTQGILFDENWNEVAMTGNLQSVSGK